MKLEKLWIGDTVIPIINGTIRWLCYGGGIAMEVELDVHPTIVDFINASGFSKENVRMTTEDHTEMSGRFSIHTRSSAILLTSDINEVEGGEMFTPTSGNTDNYIAYSQKLVSLSDELKGKQMSVLNTYLKSLVDSEIKDKENNKFIYTILEKIKSGQHLSLLDQYLIEELSYLLEQSINILFQPLKHVNTK